MMSSMSPNTVHRAMADSPMMRGAMRLLKLRHELRSRGVLLRLLPRDRESCNKQEHDSSL